MEILRHIVNNTVQERGHLYAFEGLDGVGKTTISKQLAELTGNHYLYCTDGSKMKRFRKYFDDKSTPVRFLYYFFLTLETRHKAQNLATTGDVFIDRYLPSTVAYHKALGLSPKWFSIIPNFMWDEITAMILLQVSEEERIKRLAQRSSLSASDKKSLTLAERIRYEYSLILPTRTILVSNEHSSINEVTRIIKQQIYD